MAISLLDISGSSTLSVPQWANTTNKLIVAVNTITANTTIPDSTYVNQYSNASNMLIRLSTVDGHLSGLDADLLDGQEGTFYASNTYMRNYTNGRFAQNNYVRSTFAANTYVNTYSNGSNMLSRLVLVDGALSGLDSDLLDGQHGSYYQNADNMNAGTLPAGRISDSSHGSRGGGTLHSVATTSVAGFLSASDKTKLDSVATNADVTSATNVGSSISGATAKTTIDDADVLPLDDSAASFALKKITWTNFKAAIKTYADTLYAFASRQIIAGNGMTGGGTLGADRTLTLGTPGTITSSSTNAVTSTSHTHALTLTGSDVLTPLLSVDGPASGLDADLLDGQQGAYYLAAASYTASDVLTKIKTVDGAGSGLDADLLDGQTGGYYANSSNQSSGTLPDARLSTRLGTVAKTITDWNSATENGWYMGSSVANAPDTSWWIGTVENHNGAWCTQTIHSFTADSSSDTKIYRRAQNNGTWEAWYKCQISQVEQDARYIQPSVTKNLTTGYTATTLDLGTQSSGTLTPNIASRNLQLIRNGGAFTLAAPSAEGSMVLYLYNSAPGAVTFSGFTKVNGDSLDLTVGSTFLLFITSISGIKLCSITKTS